MLRSQKLTRDEALPKIKHYCAYQERSHKEVKEKLYSLGLYKQDVELLISQMIEEGYLNEQRFATQFAGGKFRMKQWGKKRIEQELQQKQVSPYCIKKALQQIDNTDYTTTLEKLASKKWDQLKGEMNIFIKKRKLQDYLLQKGYEIPLVKQQLAQLSA